MKYFILIVFFSILTFSSSQKVVNLTEKKDYNYNIPRLEIVNKKIYKILDQIIAEKIKCNLVDDCSIYVIKVLPIQGYFFVGGLSFFRIEDIYHDSYRLNAKGFFRYKGNLFIVYSQLKDDFHPYHWAFEKTDESEQISFSIEEPVYEDFEKSRILSWWYLYYPRKDEFKLSYYIDCSGEEHFCCNCKTDSIHTKE
jgi:hypothetical protein